MEKIILQNVQKTVPIETLKITQKVICNVTMNEQVNTIYVNKKAQQLINKNFYCTF